MPASRGIADPRGERPQIMAAIGGIDIALWDIKGKHAGLPVWRVLGGEKRPIPTCATGSTIAPGRRTRPTPRSSAGFVKAGYRAVKLKTGAGSPADEAKRVRLVRKAPRRHRRCRRERAVVGGDSTRGGRSLAFRLDGRPLLEAPTVAEMTLMVIQQKGAHRRFGIGSTRARANCIACHTRSGVVGKTQALLAE